MSEHPDSCSLTVPLGSVEMGQFEIWTVGSWASFIRVAGIPATTQLERRPHEPMVVDDARPSSKTLHGSDVATSIEPVLAIELNTAPSLFSTSAKSGSRL